MTRQLFETKIKDGLFVLAVVVVIMGATLYLDEARSALRGRMILAEVYVEGLTLEVGLKPDHAVTVFRQPVGRIRDGALFAVAVQKPGETATVDLSELPLSPQYKQRLGPLVEELRTRTDIVTGVRYTIELYEERLGPLLALLGPDTQVHISTSGMLGDPLMQLVPGKIGGGLTDGMRINFPTGEPRAGDPAGRERVPGRLLESVAAIRAVQSRIEDETRKATEFATLLEEAIVAAGG